MARRERHALLVRDDDERLPERLVELAEEVVDARAVRESRLPVGSSQKTMRGWLMRARAIATRWRSPPESWCGR